jgi:DNA (cytosine-5)-methyltransferase 1
LATHGSLFDGIGGWPKAAKRFGIRSVWASEIEPFPIQVTKRHFPEMKHLGDITKINGAEIEPVDVITFGSPCQDLSVAGQRKGMKVVCSGCGWEYDTNQGAEEGCPLCDSLPEQTRSNLFHEAIRVIREMRGATNGKYPRFAVWENVPGAFSSNGGGDFKAVLEAITETDIPMPRSGRWAPAGMVRGEFGSLAWRVLDAQYWGVPQRRKRIFLVADLGGGSAGEVLFKPESLRGYFEAGAGARESAAGSATDCPGAAVFRKSQRARLKGDCETWINDEIANTLNCFDEGDKRTTHAVVVAAFKQGNTAAAGGIGYAVEQSPTLTAGQSGTNLVPAVLCFQENASTADSMPVSIDRAPPLRTTGRNAIVFGPNGLDQSHALLAVTSSIGRLDPSCQTFVAAVDCRNSCEGAVSPTLQAGTNGYSVNAQSPVRIGRRVRRLIPLECERLQGLPEGWTEEGSDTTRYKALGNGMAQPNPDYVMQGIAEVLYDFLY